MDKISFLSVLNFRKFTGVAHAPMYMFGCLDGEDNDLFVIMIEEVGRLGVRCVVLRSFTVFYPRIYPVLAAWFGDL